MPEPTPHGAARNASSTTGPEHQRIEAIFAEFLGQFHASQGTAVLPPPPSPPTVAPRRKPCLLPLPEPGRRCLRLVDPPQLIDQRWEVLSGSQVRAVRLIRAGAVEHALQTLREGTWRNPEEELRQLLTHFHRPTRRARRSAVATNPEEEAAA